MPKYHFNWLRFHSRVRAPCNLGVSQSKQHFNLFSFSIVSGKCARHFFALSFVPSGSLLTANSFRGRHMESMHHHDFLKLFFLPFLSHGVRDTIKNWKIFSQSKRKKSFQRFIKIFHSRVACGGWRITHFSSFFINSASLPLRSISLSHRECCWWLHVSHFRHVCWAMMILVFLFHRSFQLLKIDNCCCASRNYILAREKSHEKRSRQPNTIRN